MRKEFKEVKTVGELLEYLQDIPTDTPVGRMTDGYYKVNKIGDVGVFLGALPIGHPGEEVEQVILRVSA